MRDPYQVLGVSKNASDEEINNAYRELLRKYQSDTYGSAEKADAKVNELNKAYDEIMLSRRSSGSGAFNGNSGGSKVADFSDIRMKIQAGRIDDAEMLLDGMPSNMRNAEWNFLKGSILYKRGWLEEAYKYYANAVQMDPNNKEYKAALNNLNYTRNGQYRTSQTHASGCSGCDVCTSLVCADCCCECMGGDLIRCC